MTHTFTLMYTYKDIHMQGSRLNFVLWSFPLLTTTNSFAWHNLWPSSAKWCRRSLCLKRWIVCRDTGMPLNQTSRRALSGRPRRQREPLSGHGVSDTPGWAKLKFDKILKFKFSQDSCTGNHSQKSALPLLLQPHWVVSHFLQISTSQTSQEHLGHCWHFYHRFVQR